MKGNFQIIIMVVFLAAAVFGLLVFSGNIKIGKQTTAGSGGTVIMWGTAPSAAISQILGDFNSAHQTFIVKYVQKNPDTYDQNLLEAFASGTAPDIFFLPDNLAYHYMNKIYTVPFTTFSQASFASTFASASSVFMTPDGLLAFPMTIDPMVMYYNRTILNSNSVVKPPATWGDFSKLVPTLTVVDNTKKISQTAAALGQFVNVTHAKDIMAMLFMQNGNSIVGQVNGSYASILSNSDRVHNPTNALNFYLNFANPLSDVYSWNRSLPYSKDYFSAENLAFYFGYASELQNLINRNPNEDFLVAPVPQQEGASAKVTFGQVTGLAVSASSKNFNSALSAANLLATTDFAGKYAGALGIPPARLDLLSAKQTDQYNPVFFSSALYARSWLDPSPSDTDSIFDNMVEQVLSNNLTADAAIMDANSKLGILLLNKR